MVKLVTPGLRQVRALVVADVHQVLWGGRCSHTLRNDQLLSQQDLVCVEVEIKIRTSSKLVTRDIYAMSISVSNATGHKIYL